jgi:two-component system chemotaxis response regulator CheB
MVRHQIPVVMVSSMIQDGYFAFESLRLGVVDFIPKPSRVSQNEWGEQEELLRQRVLMGAGMKVHRMRRVRRRVKTPRTKEISHPRLAKGLVLMGTTLAGPNSAMRIVSNLPSNFPVSTVVLQEIHPVILEPFASYFNEISPLEVVPVVDTRRLHAGRVYIASTFNGLVVEEDSQRPGEFLLRVTESVEHPIDRLFESAAEHFKNKTCAVLLTGTGADGSDGLQRIRETGGLTVGQEQNCSVYPNLVEHAVRRNVVDALVPDSFLPMLLRSWVESGTQRARYSIIYDTLTNLPNQNLFTDRMDHAMARANRHQHKLALIYMKLNDFNQIEEDWGYGVSDGVLQETARRLEATVRTVDTVARMGVCEFAIILEDLEDTDNVSAIAQRIVEVLEAPFEIEGHQLYLHCCAGISAYPADGSSSEILVKNAKAAMELAESDQERSFAVYEQGAAQAG